MVEVGDRPTTKREATAQGSILMNPSTLDLIERGETPKGDLLAVARVAAIQAAKRTWELIPLCHPIGLDDVQVQARLAPDLPGVWVTATVAAVGRTGVEMEALAAVSLALLTVYDMVKSSGHGMEIGQIRLVEKTGGASGDWTREDG